MVLAKDLLKQQTIRNEKKYLIFNKIHSKIEAKIIKASASNYYETWYLIPEFMIGNPRYSLKECIDCINERLIKDGFKTQLFNPNLLYIKWGE